MLRVALLRLSSFSKDLRRDLLNLTDFAETKDMGEAVKEGYITEEPETSLMQTVNQLDMRLEIKKRRVQIFIK